MQPSQLCHRHYGYLSLEFEWFLSRASVAAKADHMVTSTCQWLPGTGNFLQVAIENCPFSSVIFLLKMVIFHSYVGLPEGSRGYVLSLSSYILPYPSGKSTHSFQPCSEPMAQKNSETNPGNNPLPSCFVVRKDTISAVQSFDDKTWQCCFVAPVVTSENHKPTYIHGQSWWRKTNSASSISSPSSNMFLKYHTISPFYRW